MALWKGQLQRLSVGDQVLRVRRHQERRGGSRSHHYNGCLVSPQPCPEGYYCSVGVPTDDTSLDLLAGSQLFDVVANETTFYQNATLSDWRNQHVFAANPTSYAQLCADGYFCPTASPNPCGYGACPTGYRCPGT